MLDNLNQTEEIYKAILHFHFQFEVDFAFNDIKVKNVLKVTSILNLVVL